MKRLYLQIYLTFVAILFLFGVLLGVAFLVVPSDEGRGLDALAKVAEQVLPDPSAPLEEVVALLTRLNEELDVSATVWSETGELVASAGDALPPPQPQWTESRFVPSRGAGLTVALALSDGRWVVARHRRQTHASVGFLGALMLLGVAVAVGAYPLVRRLTRRVERLQRRVDALAAGELGARVDVEGKDEVAELAKSFNRAAERIERLIDAQKTLLAGASHELRSPLARIRVASELLGDEVSPALRERIAKDISELDELLGELLLASRLDTLQGVESEDEIDLLAVAAEEASSFGAEVFGTPVTIRGDVRLLRRLIRNLLSNARRYAAGSAIAIEVAPAPSGGATLSVTDGGPGIPESERERIFEPFFRGSTAESSAEEGVGLGLSLVERIAELHGGYAECLPNPGGGSRFEVNLGHK